MFSWPNWDPAYCFLRSHTFPRFLTWRLAYFSIVWPPKALGWKSRGRAEVSSYGSFTAPLNPAGICSSQTFDDIFNCCQASTPGVNPAHLFMSALNRGGVNIWAVRKDHVVPNCFFNDALIISSHIFCTLGWYSLWIQHKGGFWIDDI